MSPCRFWDQAGRARLCMIAAVLCVLLASNIPGGEAAVGAPTQTLRFAATISATPGPRHSRYPTPLNASATGIQLGDYIAFNNDLFDLTGNSSDPGPGNRTLVGLDSGYCVVTSVPAANATSIPLNCFETLLFTEGPNANSSLTLNIVVGYGPASAPHAVNGGSGRFVGATGQVVLSNTPYAANSTAGDMYFDVTLY